MGDHRHVDADGLGEVVADVRMFGHELAAGQARHQAAKRGRSQLGLDDMAAVGQQIEHRAILDRPGPLGRRIAAQEQRPGLAVDAHPSCGGGPGLRRQGLDLGAQPQRVNLDRQPGAGADDGGFVEGSSGGEVVHRDRLRLRRGHDY